MITSEGWTSTYCVLKMWCRTLHNGTVTPLTCFWFYTCIRTRSWIIFSLSNVSSFSGTLENTGNLILTGNYECVCRNLSWTKALECHSEDTGVGYCSRHAFNFGRRRSLILTSNDPRVCRSLRWRHALKCRSAQRKQKSVWRTPSTSGASFASAIVRKLKSVVVTRVVSRCLRGR